MKIAKTYKLSDKLWVVVHILNHITRKMYGAYIHKNKTQKRKMMNG